MSNFTESAHCLLRQLLIDVIIVLFKQYINGTDEWIFQLMKECKRVPQGVAETLAFTPFVPQSQCSCRYTHIGQIQLSRVNKTPVTPLCPDIAADIR